jgi:hypothetical protein
MVNVPAAGWIEEIHVVDGLGRGYDRVVTKFHQRSDCPRIHDVLDLRAVLDPRDAPRPHDAVRCTLCTGTGASSRPRGADPVADAVAASG